MRRITTKFSGIFAVLLAAALLTSTVAAAPAATPTVYIHGRALTSAASVKLVDGVTYVPLRAFATAISQDAAVSWDSASKTASVYVSGLALTVTVGNRYLTANGRYLYLDGACYTQDGSLMVPIRPLAKAFGVEVSWDRQDCKVLVTGSYTPIEDGSTFYDTDSLYWLSRIISAEARGESLEGQIAVGNVVLNRAANAYWPEDIYGVIFDARCGVQFSPTANGTIYDEPTEQSVIAAKLALDGANVAGDSLFFLNEAIATSKWIVENCDYVTTIGNHSFYTTEI